jgi:(1->4)-alpha-D-glucan 1-alpha-D-glucosylmutase
MFLIREGLRLRAERPASFGAQSAYTPLTAGGDHTDRVVAYLRADDVVAVAPRFVMGIGGGSGPLTWANTSLALPPGSWIDRLTGMEHAGTVMLESLLKDFPTALLARS